MKKLINRFKRFEDDNSTSTGNSNVISLSPRVITDSDELSKIRPYLDELSASLAEPSITNIALAGTYGSGKSTIIKTFQSRNHQYKYLNISLASFKDNEEKKGKMTVVDGQETPVNNSGLERRLEISILQQIFYHVKPSKIPDSRFKRINNITNWKLLFVIGSLILWIISILLLFKYDYIDDLNPATWDTKIRSSWLSLFLFVIFFGGIAFFAKFLIRLFGNSKINKFSIKGEVELGDKIDKSVFNEHLEEIVYFFERTNYNVVVIEDLDRFNSTDIFTKLREINRILNESEIIKRPINFLYAIKDEMFTDKSDRVKFFDYIIPVIPFINASNADTQLQKLIESKGLQNVLSRDFVCDIVTFIDDIDMRLLINIVQEFCVYRTNIPDGNADKLFAMIVYKNLCPDDFGHLMKRKGNLFDFITKKQEYTGKLVTKIESEIVQKQAEKDKISQETITSVKELKAIYIATIHEAVPSAIAVSIDNSEVDFNSLFEDTHFDAIKKSSSIIVCNKQRYGNNANLFNVIQQHSNVSFSSVEKRINPNLSYDDREKLIEDKANGRLSKLDAEIKSLKGQLLNVKNWNLKETFEKVDIEPHLGLFKGNQLMRSLLVNGYIDEDYDDYISLFHAVLITHNDHKFEKAIKSDTYLPFDYELSKIENLLKRIPDKYFQREVVLNFNFMDYLSENHNDYENKYRMFIETLCSGSEKASDFIKQYVERGMYTNSFVRDICDGWSGFFDLFLENYTLKIDGAEGFSKAKILWDAQRKFESFIDFVDVNGIISQNISKQLTSFLSESYSSVRRISQSIHPKLQNVINELKIRFDYLAPPDKSSKPLFDYIVSNYHYAINEHNLRVILEANMTDFEADTYATANYTTILDSKIKTLIDYINTNIGLYLKSVYLKLEGNTNESEASILSILNNEKIDVNQKAEVLSRWSGKIKELTDVTNREIQQKAFELNRIEPQWQNIYAYYDGIEDGELDDTLLGFLDTDDNAMALSGQKMVITEERNKDFITKISLAIIYKNEIRDNNHARLIKSTIWTWNSLDFESLDRLKVENMVETNFLSLTQNNFDKLKEHFSNLHIRLVEKHSGTLIAKYDDLSLGSADIHKLLVSPNIAKEMKEQLIDKLNFSMFETKEIAVAACDILIASQQYIAMEYTALENMIKFTTSIEKRIKLINIHFNYLDDTQRESLIEKVGYNYKRLFVKQNKPKFPITDYNRTLFQNLLDKNLIGKFIINPKDDSEYKVSAKY